MRADGTQPLLEGVPDLWLDPFAMHACAGDWAVVEASHKSGSAYSFWLMGWQRPYWIIEAAGGARVDIQVDEPAFAAGDMRRAGWILASSWRPWERRRWAPVRCALTRLLAGRLGSGPRLWGGRDTGGGQRVRDPQDFVCGQGLAGVQPGTQHAVLGQSA